MDLLSVIVSPLIGAVGGMFQQWVAFKRERAEIEDRAKQRDHERAMAQLTTAREIKLAELEQAGRERTAAIEGEFALGAADLENLRQSMPVDRRAYLADGAQERSKGIAWMMAAVDVVRGLIRPVLTVALTWATWELSQSLVVVARAVNGGMIAPDAAARLLEYVVVGIVQLTLIAVGWWFASRGAQLPATQRVFGLVGSPSGPARGDRAPGDA